MDTALEMPNASIKAHILLFFLCVILPVLLTGGILGAMKHELAFKLSFVILGICLPIYLFISLALFGTNVKIDNEHLTIKAGFYSERINLNDIKASDMQMINLDEQNQYKPMFRTNGIGLPGFNVGHFTLKNRTKAFIVQTNSNAVYLSLSNGKAVLLTPSNPEQFFNYLQAQI